MSDNERWEKEKEDLQSDLKHDFAKEIVGREVTDEEVDSIICAELNDSDDDEYLLDGALLTCTKAKWEDFQLSDGSVVHIDKMEEKKEQGDPKGILRVWENPLISSTNGYFQYATVADAVKFQNISPFLCNCKEPANVEQEQKIKENMDECRKYGVCQYLMDLEEEWENIDFGNVYKPFLNICIAPTLGSAQFMGSPQIISKEEKEGIIMTSVLFCKHGGFIYPIMSGQDQGNSITETQAYIKIILETLGWSVELTELRHIELILSEFGITDRNSITCFLLICVSESGRIGLYADKVDRNGEKYVDEYGRGVTEYYPIDYDPGYEFEERGVGYMQVTFKKSQYDCLDYLETNGYYEGKIDPNALGYVQELRKLPWEASAWRWSVYVQTIDGYTLNEYVINKVNENENQLTMGVFLAAESFVNGKVKDGASEPLGKIAIGEIEWEYDKENNMIITDIKTFPAPNNWYMFEANYDILKEAGLL